MSNATTTMLLALCTLHVVVDGKPVTIPGDTVFDAEKIGEKNVVFFESRGAVVKHDHPDTTAEADPFASAEMSPFALPPQGEPDASDEADTRSPAQKRKDTLAAKAAAK